MKKSSEWRKIENNKWRIGENEEKTKGWINEEKTKRRLNEEENEN